MTLTNQFHLTTVENQRRAQQDLACLIQNNACFEDLHVSLSVIQSLLNHQPVPDLSNSDQQTLTQLIQGWQWAIDTQQPLDLRFERKLNTLVAKFDALIPGALRDGPVSVGLIDQSDYFPAPVDEDTEADWLQRQLQVSAPTTEIALRVLYHNMRAQLFWDGNKRTAIIAANHLMITHGAGFINVKLTDWPTWLRLISDYYRTNELAPLMDWSWQHAIQGIPEN